jgi:hypothetical protein
MMFRGLRKVDVGWQDGLLAADVNGFSVLVANRDGAVEVISLGAIEKRVDGMVGRRGTEARHGNLLDGREPMKEKHHRRNSERT